MEKELFPRAKRDVFPSDVRAGDMAIVYGMPTGLASDRVDGVVLRTWLLKRERTDLRILRTPLR